MNLLLDAMRRLYGALLLLLPAEIRRSHGSEMRTTSRNIVEETLRRRGPMAALAAALAECSDVVRAAASASRRAPSEFRQDVAYAWRLTWRRPAFTLTVVATLAVGIGATTIVFTVVDALLLRPLPFRDAERLVLLTSPGAQGSDIALSPLDFHDISRDVRAFRAATAFTPQQVNLTGDADPERIDAAGVTWNFFDVIGATLHLGRGFSREEGQTGGDPVAVISHALWQRRFGGSADIVGRRVMVDGRPTTIVGIGPVHPILPRAAQLWRPLVFTPHQIDPSQRGARWIFVVARLERGVSMDEARGEVGALGARLAADFPATHRDRAASVRPLRDHLVSNTRSGVLALFGAVAFVLLIACANVANLLLARSSARSSEMSVRMALGASRPRLLRQHLVENLFLAGIAAAIGVGLAAWGTRVAVTVLPESLPRANEIGVNARVAAFSVIISILVALMLSAAAASGVCATTAAASARMTNRARSVRRMLVVGEVAMALVLVASAGLFVKSLLRLYGVSPGFDASRVLTFSLALPSTSYPEPDRIALFMQQLRSELSLLPGVESAAAIFGLPLTTDFSAFGSFAIAGRAADPNERPRAMVRVTTPDYFRTMRITFVRGRDFTDRDVAGQPGVAIINEAAARRFWPGEDPIGQTIQLNISVANAEQPPRTIVGIVRNVRYDGLDAEAGPETYVPHAQHPVDAMVVALRARGDEDDVLERTRAVLKRLDPALPMASVATMNDLVDQSVAPRRFSLMLLVAFAGIALLLAATGIYGVLSYTVGQRTREIGVRIAVGAARGHVVRLVVAEGLLLAGIGLLLGLAGTLAVTGVIRGLLYEVQPTDPQTLALVAVVLLIVAVAASYVPARRAAAVDPVTTLRAE
jgi:putative ABC transport system permease protein